MTLKEQDLLRRLQNVGVFGDTYRAEFAPTSHALAVFDELKPIIAGLQNAQSQQEGSSGGAIGSTRAKWTILDELYQDQLKIEATARQIRALTPQQKGYFVRPVRREMEIVGAARAFIEQATPLWSQFVAYEMPATLLTDMQADLDEYQATYGAQQSERQTRIAAGDEIGTLIERGGDLTEELRPIIKNKFAGNAGVLAAWASAVRYPERDKTKKVVPVVGA